MPKIAIITDTHFGARNDSQAFLNYFERFFEDVFWPEIERQNITAVIHLGDLVDRKKYISYNSYYTMRRVFLDRFKEDMQLFIIPGNHDSYYKNTLEINAIDEICSANPYISVINFPTEMKFYGSKVLMLPWICQDNAEKSFDLINTSDAPLCMGHLELTGFKFNRMRVCDHGLSPVPFRRFKRTFSGHFHHKSQQDNIFYLGAPYEMTWEDWNDARGFHIYDFDKDDLEFIQNPYRIHEKIEYDTTLENNLSAVDFSFYKDKFVKVLVKDKKDIAIYMSFIDKMESSGAFGFDVVENAFKFDDTSPDITVDELEDTLDILNRYVEENEMHVNKEKLAILMTDLYKMSQLIEV